MTQQIPLPHRVGPKIPIPEVPVHSLMINLINATVEADPNRVAFIHHDNPNLPNLTYKQLLDKAARFANFLHSRKLAKKGEILALSIPSSWHYGATVLALPANGLTMTGFSHRNTPDEALYQLTNSESIALITTTQKFQTLLPYLNKAPRLRFVILIDRPTSGLKTNLPVFIWDETVERAEPKFDFDSVEINVHEDLYVLPYSSGTTGLPKGVMITHYNYVAMLLAMKTHTENNILEAIKRLGVDTDEPDHPIAITPLYHAMGFFLLNANMARGQSIVFIQNYKDEVVFDAIQKYKIRAFTVPPAVCQRFMQSPKAKNYDLSSVVNIGTGGSTQSAELAQQFQRQFPDTKVMSQGYGMTELTTVSHSSSIKAKAGSIGIILPNLEYRIVEPETGKECGTDEIGELWVRGPTRMKGYWKNERATREMITPDSWLKTGCPNSSWSVDNVVGYMQRYIPGDLVREDSDRQLFVVSRLKELIKVNAFQVSPTELEELISQLSGVADCAVIGIPNGDAGELPRAFIVKKSGAVVSAKQIIDHVAQKASHYKWLKGGVEFVQAIRRNETGKILRREILRSYQEKMQGRQKSRL